MITTKVFTKEQQARLGVNQYGEHDEAALGLGENADAGLSSADRADDKAVRKQEKKMGDVLDDENKSLAPEQKKTETEKHVSKDDSEIAAEKAELKKIVDAGDTDLPSDDPWPWN